MLRPWDEHLILSCLLVIMIFTYAIVAQDNQIPIEKFVSMLPIGQTEISAESIMSFILENPQILNKALKSQLVEKSRFLSDLNLEFKTFKADGTDSLLGLGIGYNYQRDLVMTTIKEKTARQTGLSLAFQTHGNVAFDKDTNPNDFLDADLSFSLYNSWGGAFTTSDIIRDKLNELETEMVKYTDGDKLRSSPYTREFARIVQNHLSSQYYLDFALSGGIESNQDFTRMQYVFGSRLGFDFKPWGSGYWNVFDWPFAAIRWFSGYDEELLPRGSSFPTVLLGIDQISPRADEYREALGDSSDFFRWRGEIAFRTPINSSSYFEANVRYYKELNAADAIKQADQDEHLYFAAVITTGSGIFASYSTGKLPFDLQSQQVYSLGFKFNF